MNVIHDQVVAASSNIVDKTNVTTMTAMTENTFLLQATDQFKNNTIYCEEHPHYTNVTVEGKDIDTNKTRICYVGAGLYDVSVTMLCSGRRKINIKVNGSEIKRAPFNVTVLPGTFVTSST